MFFKEVKGYELIQKVNELLIKGLSIKESKNLVLTPKSGQ